MPSVDIPGVRILWYQGIGLAWITGRQIEAARQAVTRYMKREGQIWIRVFPDKPITKKPAEVRMGKGKGAPEDLWQRLHPAEFFSKRRSSFRCCQGSVAFGCTKTAGNYKIHCEKGLCRNLIFKFMKTTEIRELSTKEIDERIENEKSPVSSRK